MTLVRNIGSSIGISMVIANLTSKTTEMHASLAEQVTPFNDALQMPDVASDPEHRHRHRPRHARRHRDAAGGDDRLPQRLQAADVF